MKKIALFAVVSCLLVVGAVKAQNMAQNTPQDAFQGIQRTQATSSAQVPHSVQQMQLSFAPLVKKSSPAVVNIYAKLLVRQQMRINSPFANDPFFSQFFGGPFAGGPVREKLENSLGSGVIVDPNGLIATNTHVIRNATEITVVTADGREFAAEKVLADDRTDLAILRIQPKSEPLAYLDLANSDAVEVGDLVLAIGNPFGVGQTVTSGIVSGVARTMTGLAPGLGGSPTDYSFFIQTDASINPGNSGGALVNMQGQLVGINSMIFSKDGATSVGIGFAIPANMVKTVIDASRHGGKLVRPWTGVSGQPVTTDMIDSLGLNRAQGSLIGKVHPDSPAAKAGIQPGDVILSMDGYDVQDPQAMKFRLATLPIGSSVKLQVMRDRKKIDLVMVTEAPVENPPRDESKLTGVTPLTGAVVINLSPAVIEEFGGALPEQGVMIKSADDGNAARLGLRPRDVVLAVNGQKVDSVAMLKDQLTQKAGRWMLQILRGTQIINLTVN